MERRARFGRRMATVALAMLGCAGCSSFQGRPDPVMPTRSALAAAHAYTVSQALARWEAAGDDTQKRAVRDRFIALRVDAADAQYARFLANVSVASKGGGFGLDLIGLGLSGGGAVAGKATANALSAAAVGVAGTRAAFNKDAFFEKALPAVVAEMAAARIRALAAIRAGEHKTADAYTLADAMMDVNAYETAASLDGGIQALAQSAGEDAQAQATAFKAEFGACLPDADTYAPSSRLSAFLNGLVENDPAGTLDRMLSALSITPTAGATAQDKADLILDYASQKLCTYAAMKAVLAPWDPADFP